MLLQQYPLVWACINSSHISTDALLLLLTHFYGDANYSEVLAEYEKINTIPNSDKEHDIELLDALFNHNDFSDEAKAYLIITFGHNIEEIFDECIYNLLAYVTIEDSTNPD